MAILKFKNGALGVIEGSTACYSSTCHPPEVHLCGSDGSIFMRDDTFPVWDFRKKNAWDSRTRKKFSPLSDAEGAGAADPAAIGFLGHQLNFEDAVQAISKGTSPLVDGAEGRKSIEIILAIYRSALAGGKPVKLPLKRTPVRKSFV